LLRTIGRKSVRVAALAARPDATAMTRDGADPLRR